MTDQTTPQSGPILDLETAVRVLGALPMPAGNEPEMPAEQRAAIAELIGDAKPATARLVEQLAKSVRDRREHDHPEWEDLYCLNLVSWMGERMGPVLRRLLDAEDRIERRRSRLVALQNDALDMRGSLSPNGEARKVPFPLGETLTPAVDWLIARVAELENDREANDREYEQATARVAELEKAAVEGRAALASFCADHEDPGTAALGALYLLQQATTGTPMQPGETVPKVYRASHDSIPMGLYLTAAEARKHCETEMRRDLPTVVLDWIEDEEDDVAELVASVGVDERVTGYVVDALEIAAEYDTEADQ
ncbi:hypothetical protein ACIQFW_04255 [Streptomyces ardesiacus]|uniref:hypothetical protein n=1 Tax=Streptomyces ardesiacus TaxID=285564 RepID=UPI003824A0C1